MNKYQREILGNRITSEETIIKELKENYKQALKDIEAKVNNLMRRLESEEGEINRASIEYQLGYQKSLEMQITAILEQLQTRQFESVSKFLQQSYEDGFIGTMYDLQHQGIPLTIPIDQKQVIKALKTDTRLSKGLWGALAEKTSNLQKQIRSEISRGISQGFSYSKVARFIAERMNVDYSLTARIVRTESHRITQEATLDAQHKAKDKGAEVVKQWDATLDGRTRKDHRKLDGQIRELDEPFEIGGYKAMCPGKFGRPEQDINCRCTILQRAKWALDDDELETLKERAKYYGLDKSKDFKEYRQKFYKAENWLNEQTTFSEKNGLTYNEQDALSRYVSSEYLLLNEALRNDSKLNGIQKAMVKNLKSGLNKLPSYKGDLTRSLQFRSKDALNEFLQQHQKGKTVAYNQFISTSKGEVFNPDGQVQLIINDAKNGKDISVFNDREDEVLYNIDSKFKVEDTYEENGVYYILLKEK